jgi:SSS family solute:Na+ symporter
MLTFLPNGFLGLVVASLIAAFMSTISTHLNWGSSYIVHDFYRRFLNNKATEKQLVTAARICTLLIMIIASLVGLYTENAKKLFDFILLFGGGTGLIFILRWFWWRINAWSEISAMFASGILALFVNKIDALTIEGVSYHFLFVVICTTCIWLMVTFLTKPTEKGTLIHFYNKTRPGGPGWKRFKELDATSDFNVVRAGIIAMLLGCMMVYSILIGFGKILYQDYLTGCILVIVSALSAYGLFMIWKKMEAHL